MRFCGFRLCARSPGFVRKIITGPARAPADMCRDFHDPPMKTHSLPAIALAACISLVSFEANAHGPGPVGNFGPTGLEIDVRDNGTALVTAVQPGSPAEGLVEEGEIIHRIQGEPLPGELWDL